ncbi:MAG: serine/threonine protein kinase [Proteobacteria bacterium]|nr:serine/threonine protein kinase [Pseudomonadota bacterium]MCP4920944.1 serine/threonine protein kinase [Pseudomonadota bacterium]
MAALADRYELGDMLGAGGAARVLHARDRRLGVDRAVKLISGSEGPMRAQLRTRLEREARAMAQLDHPNVLRIYDIGHDDGQDYVVMDLADGGSLSDWLRKRGPMAPDVALPFMIQVLAALAAAHAAGIVHRDVKPQNILLDLRGKALLADFGIAMLDDNQRTTKTGIAMGSVAYMAPEQRLDARSVGPAADLYATGATLYHLLTRANPVDLFTADAASSRFDGVPPRLRDVLVRATRLSPTQRYPDARSMALDLLELMSDGGAIEGLDPKLFADPAPELSGGHPETVIGDLPEGPSVEATQGAITFLGDDFELFRARLADGDLRGPELTELPQPTHPTLIAETDPLPEPKPSSIRWPLVGVVVVSLLGVGAVAFWPDPPAQIAPVTTTVLPEPEYAPGIAAVRSESVERTPAAVAAPPFGVWRFTMNGRSHDLKVRGTIAAIQATWTSRVGAGLDTPLTGTYSGGVLTLRSDDGDVFSLTFDGHTFVGRLSGVRSADVLNGRRP